MEKKENLEISKDILRIHFTAESQHKEGISKDGGSLWISGTLLLLISPASFSTLPVSFTDLVTFSHTLPHKNFQNSCLRALLLSIWILFSLDYDSFHHFDFSDAHTCTFDSSLTLIKPLIFIILSHFYLFIFYLPHFIFLLSWT